MAGLRDGELIGDCPAGADEAVDLAAVESHGGRPAAAATASRARLRDLTGRIRRDILVLWLAARDRRTPWLARLAAGLAAAYVFSPVQLIPNFIPFVGQLDDLLVVTLGGWVALKLTPAELLDELRSKAREIQERPVSRWAAAVVTLVWIGLAGVAAAVIWG